MSRRHEKLGTCDRLILAVKRAPCGQEARERLLSDKRLRDKESMLKFMEPMCHRGLSDVVICRVLVGDDAYVVADMAHEVRRRSGGTFTLTARDGWVYLRLLGVPDYARHTWGPLDVLSQADDATTVPFC